MDYDEAKEEVMRLHPAHVRAARVAQLANRDTAEAGYVVWNALPPAPDRNVPEGWTAHRETFADAIYTALGFCLSDFRHEWAVMGRVGAVAVRSLSKFKEVEGTVCWPTDLIYIGQLGIVSVYFNRQLPATEFMAGVLHGSASDAKLCCRGVIENSSISYGNRAPLHMPAEVRFNPSTLEIYRIA